MIINDSLLLKIVNEFQNKYNCHTIILYGSRARGDHTKTSDYDIIGLREKGDLIRDCRIIDGHYLDAFVYSENEINNNLNSFMRIKDGKVIIQQGKVGDKILENINKIFISGPSKTSVSEKNEIIV